MTNLPSSYAVGLPRVSAIVEYNYPFTCEPRQRFLEWLERKEVSYSAYMKEASSWGHYVHSALETFLKTRENRGRKYRGYVNSWISFVNDYWVSAIAIEEYVKCKDYQWTIDLVCTINWEKWIIDWKNYWLAKDKFNIPQPEYKRPTEKLKKARLQLSLYARCKRIKNIGVVELRSDGYHFHKLELIPKDELNSIIQEFKMNYIDEL